MKYLKPAATYKEQAEILLSRGMSGVPDKMAAHLEVTNYYRLSGYWYPFRRDANNVILPDSKFRDGTTFDEVWSWYTFDRHLRLIVMDAIERFEVSVRAWLTYEHSHAYGPFDYATDPKSLPDSKLSLEGRTKMLEELQREMDNPSYPFVTHFKNTYGDEHSYMPIWMACETMTFGQIIKLFRGISTDLKNKISKKVGFHRDVFLSFLVSINTVRNICAHHGRLWNRGFGTKLTIPKYIQEFHAPVKVGNDQLFGILTMLKYCMKRICPQSAWENRFHSLLEQYPAIPLKFMGFPENWLKCPIWNRPLTPKPVSPNATEKNSGTPASSLDHIDKKPKEAI